MTTRRPSTRRRASPRGRPPCCRRRRPCTNFLSWSVPIARSLISSAGSALGWPMRSARELAGHQACRRRCRTPRARRTVPLARVDLVVDQLQLARDGVARCRRCPSRTGMCSSCARALRRSAASRARARPTSARRRRSWRRSDRPRPASSAPGALGPAATRLPTVISSLPTRPGDRRAHLRVAEIELGRSASAASAALQVGVGFACGVVALVEIALRRSRASPTSCLPRSRSLLVSATCGLRRRDLRLGARRPRPRRAPDRS